MSGRCKACNAKFTNREPTINTETGLEEELCTNCLFGKGGAKEDESLDEDVYLSETYFTDFMDYD